MAKSRHAHAFGGPRVPRPDPPGHRPRAARTPRPARVSPSTPASTRPPTACTWATSCSCARCAGSRRPGHRPISLAGGGTGHDRRPGREAGRAAAARPRDDRGSPRRASAPSSAQFLDLQNDRALLLNNADWLGSISILEFLRDVGKHFTVNQMVAQGVGQDALRAAGPGHLVHRVQLHAAAGLRLPAPPRRPRLSTSSSGAATSGATSPWASSSSARSAATRSWGLTTPLVVKADGTKYGKTESGTVWLDPAADQSLRHVPVLRQHAGRAGR